VSVAALYGLELRTPRLVLRLGTREELVELAAVAEAGIHPPDEMPFLVPWTDRVGEPGFLDMFLEHHEGHLRDWSPDEWALNLLVMAEGRLAGSQSLTATAFAANRRVATGSWLGQSFQRRGFGTEMRRAVLELAFRGLGAESAESGAMIGNVASQRVSAKIGYRVVGEETRAPRREPVRELVYRLDWAEWPGAPEVEIHGLEPCLELFGAA